MRRYRTLGASVAVSAGIVFLTLLLVVSPGALGVGAGVHLKAPYSGAAATGETFTDTGGNCNGAGSLTLTAPSFSLARGRGGVNQESVALACTTDVDDYHELVSTFGLNTTTFTPATTLTHDKVRFKWDLNYWLIVNSSWGGGSQLSYAYAAVGLHADVADLTAGTSVGSPSVYNNYTYQYDSTSFNGIAVFVSVQMTMVVPITLVAGHQYEFQTWVIADTRAEVDGPVNGADAAAAQVIFESPGPEARLLSISY